MKVKDLIIFLTLFICFFVYYVTQNPHYGVLTGEEMTVHHLDMVYEGSPEVPRGLKIADSPAYPIGSQAISLADHMSGMMRGVEVTIVAAYETTAYSTTYTSTNSGMLVKDHKWIVHEEFVDVGDDRLADSTKTLTKAEHMKGMSDAVHTIDNSLKTTVYMVDFVLPNGIMVTNHKWVVEEELAPVK
ncbi:DUF1541 domain-containing protein [Filobacillus milosensis]|nr:DUF1541 domain-containing protein [Filobacillus milosensis]